MMLLGVVYGFSSLFLLALSEVQDERGGYGGARASWAGMPGIDGGRVELLSKLGHIEL